MDLRFFFVHSFTIEWLSVGELAWLGELVLLVNNKFTLL
jgi:hypothetical protein